jgi:hypothetical protein
MNAEQSTLKIFALVRDAGTVSLMDLVARCNLPPDQLFEALQQLADEGLIDIQNQQETLAAASKVFEEVAHRDDQQSLEAVRSSLFFALHDRYKKIGSAPVSPAP